MTQEPHAALNSADLILNPDGTSSVVLVCEHASNYIPKEFHALGLPEADQKSHAAWDPGALAVTTYLSQHLNAVAVAGGVSRLVYDCNRPPSAPDAMPMRSEIIDVPGNFNLTQQDRDARTQAFYRPFEAALSAQIAQTHAPIIITIHSFTPIYHGKMRDVEIGVLHDTDSRLADAMLDCAQAQTQNNVQRNEPYGPEHGVTHTLKEHAITQGHPNVMLEIRNDLIATPEQQKNMAQMIAQWIAQACAQMTLSGDVQCQA